MKIRTPFVITLAIGLLASSAIGVAAQDEVTDPLAPARFNAQFLANDYSPHEDNNGIAYVWGEFDARDPRADGDMALAVASTCAGVENEQSCVDVRTLAVSLVNSAGTWTGIGTELVRPTVQGKKTEREYARRGTIWSLEGDGAYEGLSLFIVPRGLNPLNVWGTIVPTDTVPAFPELPAADVVPAQGELDEPPADT